MNAKFVRLGQTIVNLELISRAYYCLPCQKLGAQLLVYFDQDCLSLVESVLLTIPFRSTIR